MHNKRHYTANRQMNTFISPGAGIIISICIDDNYIGSICTQEPRLFHIITIPTVGVTRVV